MHYRRLLLLVAPLALVLGCGGAQRHARRGHLERKEATRKATKPPRWVSHVDVTASKLCGVGVAGAAFDENSPYPKQLSEDRAVRNLAGVLETMVQETIIDRNTTRSQSVEIARLLTVDDALIEQVKSMAETDYWLDVDGTGPFQQKNFTYAHTCIDAKVAAGTFKFDPKKIAAGKKKVESISPKRVPKWTRRTGTQEGEKVCAVGFSLPTFHPDKTFVVVVEDIRLQLAKVLQTLVSSYYEELSTDEFQWVEMMNMGITQAISKGAIVTDFWYDRDGIGPFKRKRTTYGWGCVYPVDVMLKTVEDVEEELPENVVAKVRERAKAAFDELDAEIEKRE